MSNGQALCNNNLYENIEVILHQVEKVYREAVTTLQPQSMVFTGRSGSGKTCNFKKAVEYLVDTTQDEAEPIFTSIISMNLFDNDKGSFQKNNDKIYG